MKFSAKEKSIGLHYSYKTNRLGLRRKKKNASVAAAVKLVRFHDGCSQTQCSVRHDWPWPESDSEPEPEPEWPELERPAVPAATSTPISIRVYIHHYRAERDRITINQLPSDLNSLIATACQQLNITATASTRLVYLYATDDAVTADQYAEMLHGGRVCVYYLRIDPQCATREGCHCNTRLDHCRYKWD